MTVKNLIISSLLACWLWPLTSIAALPQVEMDTNMGKVRVELESYRAPQTVQNFLRYVNAGFYTNLIFHRIEADFVVQGGGFNINYEYMEPNRMVRNESDNGLENLRGTIAMARTDDVHSANSQFYFNLKDNRSLDARYGRLGYTVFGRVIEGMDVLDAMGKVAVGSVDGVGTSVPVNPVVIRTIKVIDPNAEKESEDTSANQSKTEEKP